MRRQNFEVAGNNIAPLQSVDHWSLSWTEVSFILISVKPRIQISLFIFQLPCLSRWGKGDTMEPFAPVVATRL